MPEIWYGSKKLGVRVQDVAAYARLLASLSLALGCIVLVFRAFWKHQTHWCSDIRAKTFIIF